ncbi:MAG: ABC transporter permease [Nitrososphaerota archaeon]|nr:ABC transporter permease [Nitrososphaerota archaeon]MDG6939826.1 ABC transporter permease [Nitrososphaerota archaeon]
MRLSDAFWFGLKGLTERKMRAVLTIAMVMIGVASIIALVSQTTGIEVSINSSLQSLGPTSVLVSPAQSTRLTDADVARLSGLPGVLAVVPIITSRATLLTAGQTTPVSIIGVSDQGLLTLLGGVNLYEGSAYPDSVSPLALVGNGLAFPQPGTQRQSILTGHPITLQQQVGSSTRVMTLSVSGILQYYGSSPLIPVDTSIFLSLDAAKQLLGRTDYSMLLVKTSSVQDVSTVDQMISNIYGNSVQVTTIQQITRTVSSITGQIGLLLAAIAGISLTVAAIGITNIMFVTVLERTREIGILKAIGFGDGSILLIFLSQAALIGVIGGVTGLAVGGGMSYLIPLLLSGFSSNRPAGGSSGFGPRGGGFSISYTPIITPEIMLTAISVAVLVSMVAGLYPAWRASRMEPAKALRYE